MRSVKTRVPALLASAFLCGTLAAQQSQNGALAADVLSDQKAILTSPLHIRTRDLGWVLPLSAASTVLFLSDTRNLNERLHTDPTSRSESAAVSNAGLAAIAGAPAALYWWGWRHNDNYALNSALLAARAATDALIAGEFIGVIARRERPAFDNAAGGFENSAFQSNSFPSRHAALAWSMASVVANRYPGWLTELGVYGAASAVSLSRISAGQHFPSDVLVGSALGFLVGRYVANHGSIHVPKTALFRTSNSNGRSANESAGSQDSTYVPMDSWVYASLDRLAALGFIPSQISGLRPWTRNECRRQIDQAESLLRSDDETFSDDDRSDAERLLTQLEREFPSEEDTRPSVVLDSVYVRDGLIAGKPLEDSFHFGQTLRNDFGRPFGRGENSQDGFIARGESGHFFAYVRGEYQHAPGESAYSEPVRELIAGLDGNPVLPAESKPDTNRFRTIEAYAGVRLGNFDVSAGKQALYWGPTFDAPLSFSNNAEPTKNARVSLVNPVRFGGLLRYLGDIRAEAVIGKLGGQSYTWRPWFNAAKVSFKLTSNLEMGFTRWSILWGEGHPITAGSLIDNLISTNSPRGNAGIGRTDPGDRKAGFDFRYRVPGLRNWLTLYSDSYSDDDTSPLAAPRRAAINPGIYLTHVPHFHRLDFRLEAPMTRPFNGDQGGRFVYYNNQYHSGNTNYGYLLGNPEGRDARAFEGWARYWFNSRDKLEAGYRQVKTGARFLPGGGTQSDFSLKDTFDVSGNLYADIVLQYERYFIPALGGPQRNLTAVMQLTWHPNAAIVR